MMYMTAGYLVGQLKENSWEEVVQKSLFDPLGMNSSLFSVDEMQLQTDYACPYMEQDGQHTRIPFRAIDAVGPAGSINSNLVDMIAWLQFQSHQGEWEGTSLISKEQMKVMHSPQMACDSAFNSKELPVSTYGLGWMIEPYRGHAMIHHGGAIDGFASQVAFLPEEQIGIVVLSNTHGSIIPYTVAFHIMDRLLGLEPVNWSSRMSKLMGKEPAETETNPRILRNYLFTQKLLLSKTLKNLKLLRLIVLSPLMRVFTRILVMAKCPFRKQRTGYRQPLTRSKCLWNTPEKIRFRSNSCYSV